MTARPDNQRGFTMIFALGFMVVTLITALGVHTLVVGQLQSSGLVRRRVAAEFLAQAGVAQALGWFNSQGYLLPQASTLTATVPVNRASNAAPLVLPGNHPDSYTNMLGQPQSGVVTSFNSYLTSQSASGGTYSAVASLISQSPEVWELLATGQYGNIQRQVGAILYRQYSSLYSDGIFGRDSVMLEGTAFTDSYDSSKGAYGGANLGQSGNVRSNGNITLSSTADVYGNAVPGPGKSVTLLDKAAVSGSTSPAQSAKTLQPVVVPAVPVDHTLGAVVLNNSMAMHLSAGTWVATSLSVTDNAQFIIDSGPVYLYVSGSIIMGGNGIIKSVSSRPQDLQVFESGNAPITVADKAAFYGTMYAPNSAMEVGGTQQLYGAFVAASMKLRDGAGTHYDQSLNALGGTPSTFKLVTQWTVPSL